MNCVRLDEYMFNEESLLENLVSVESEGISSNSNICCKCDKSKQLAVAHETLLSIFSLPDTGNNAKLEPQAELEFDHSLQAICWDEEGKCLIVGDSAGNMHFVTNTGALIFSHRVLPRGQTAAFLAISMFRSKSTTNNEFSTLITVMASGLIFGISNLPIEKICQAASNNPQSVSTIIQSLQFFKCSLSIQPLQKVTVYTILDEEEEKQDNDKIKDKEIIIKMIAIDIQQRLHIFQIDNSSAATAKYTCSKCDTVSFLSSSPCIDAIIISISSQHGKRIGTLQQDGMITILHANTGVKLTCTKLHSPMSKFILCGAGVLLNPTEMSIAPIEVIQNIPWFGLLIVANDGVSPEMKAVSLTGIHDTYRLLVIGTINDIPASQRHACIGRGSSSTCGTSFLKTDSTTNNADLCVASECVWEVTEGLCRGIGYGCDVGQSAYSPNSTAELIGILLQKNICESSLSMVLESLPALSRASDVFAILHTLMSIRFLPAAGVLENAIQCAQRAVESIIVTYDTPSPKLIELLEEYSLRLETATEMTWDPPDIDENLSSYFHIGAASSSPSDADDLDAKVADAERVRRRFLLLIAPLSSRSTSTVPSANMSTVSQLQEEVWARCTTAGMLQDSSLILKKHLSSCLPTLLVRALKAIPQDSAVVTAEDICTWFKDGLFPALVIAAVTSPSGAYVAKQCVAELCRRARLLEQRQQHPFDSIMLAKLAEDLATRIPNHENDSAAPQSGIANIVEDASNLHSNLRLQAAIRKRWGTVLSLETVTNLRLQGFVHSRLWQIAERDLLREVHGNIRLLVKDFGGDLDAILLDWLKDATASRVILFGSSDGERGQQDNSTCSLSRLISGVGLINNNVLRAKAVLLLLQLPSSEPAHLTNSSFDEHSEVNNNESFIISIVKQLVTMAQELVACVDSTLSEALVEAIRMHRLRTLAAEYQIVGFDLRDSRQVRAAVCAIASRVSRPTSVKDAIDFAGAWTTTSVDLSAMFSRALIVRAMDTEVFDVTDNGIMAKTKALHDVLTLIPNDRIERVVDGTLSYFIGMMKSIMETDSGSSQLIPGKLITVDDEAEVVMLCDGAITITSWFLDNWKATADCKSTQPSIRSQKYDQAETNWISPDLLLRLKRLSSIQGELSVFLSLSQLADSKVCHAVATRLAESRALEMLSITASNSPSAHDKMGTPLTSNLRRACVLLDVSPLFMTQAVLRTLLASGAMEQSMCVAQALGKEAARIASSGAVPVSTASGDGLIGEGGQLLLDAAVALCSAVTKQAIPANTGKPKVLGGKRNTTPGSLFPPNSAQTTAAAFSTSRNLLQSATISTTIDFIPKTVDLLTNCQTVLAVYERLEGHDSNRISSNSMGSGTSGGKKQSAQYGAENNPMAVNAVAASGDKGKDGQSKSPVKSNSGQAANVLASYALPSQLTSQSLFRVCESEFTRDGILMSSASVLTVLLKHTLKESQRRLNSRLVTKSAATEAPHNDIDDLVSVLQKSENHMLAIRVLLNTWSMNSSKAQALRSSYLSLGRKILGYREIDSPYAVACLSAVPYELMVRELKAAVPSIQSDFSRLRTVAMIGEQLAHLWHQDELLLVFQDLQTNARWWHTLSSYGVKIDARALQSAVPAQREACIKAVVPELLEKSQLNLNIAIEYCDQFDLEPSVAVLCYLERVLTQAPSLPTDTHWTGHLQRAASRLADNVLLQSLRSSLTKIHPLDYEKIQYVCAWLTQLLSDGVDDLDDVCRAHSNDEEANPVDKSSMSDTSMCGMNSVELETYKRYGDITKFLSGLAFPVEATREITASSSTYTGLMNVYCTRLPLWTLLDDPWGIIVPVMEAAPDIASKLAPLCVPLQLDRDEFYSRRAIAMYNRSTALSVKNVDKVARGGTDVIESPFDILKEAAQYIGASARKVDLWRWLYGRERGVNDYIALQALQLALECVAECSQYRDDDNNTQEYASLHSELSTELRILHCEIAVKKVTSIVDTKSNVPPSIPPYLSVLLPDPLALLRKILETSLDVAWNTQLGYLCTVGNVLSVLEMSRYPLCPEVCIYLKNVAQATEEIAKQIQSDGGSAGDNVEDRDDKANMAQGASSRQTSPNSLESLRSHIIGKLLADTDPIAQARSAKTQNATSQVWGGMWSTTMESVTKPTEAEMRRREDLYFGFCLTTIVYSCPAQEPLRSTYAGQLEAVARGKGTKNSRRLTSRSRLRALFALFLLGTSSKSDLTPTRPTDNAQITFDVMLKYLFCLAELHEIRLSCTEQTLAESLGVPSTMASTGSPSATATLLAQPAILVRTWLHDEGHHCDVAELCRDVLLSSSCQDHAIWTLVLEHMERCGQRRALFTTALAIRSSRVFSLLCRSDVALQFLRIISITLNEAVERAEYLGTLIFNQHAVNDFTGGPSVTGHDMDSVSVSEFGDGDGETASQVGSVRGAPYGSVSDARFASVARPSRMGDESSSKEKESQSKPQSLSSRRILLVPKCRNVTGQLMTAAGEKESPEDLAQLLRDVSALFEAVLSAIGVQTIRASSTLHHELQSIWDLSNRLLVLSAQKGVHHDLIHWGTSLETMICIQAESAALTLIPSGMLSGQVSHVLVQAMSDVGGVSCMESLQACWRTLCSVCSGPSAKLCLDADLDAIFSGSILGASTEYDLDGRAREIDSLLSGFLGCMAVTWDTGQQYRCTAKRILEWTCSSEERRSQLLDTLIALPEITQESVYMAAEVLQCPFTLQS